ncbi:MAG: YrdB family protein [Anaerolineales bacterium]
MSALKSLNAALRFVLELLVLAALAYSGLNSSLSGPYRIALSILGPVAAAAIWGTLGAPHAAHRRHGLQLALVEAVVFGSAPVALWSVGRKDWAIAFIVVFVVNRGLMLIWNQ